MNISKYYHDIRKEPLLSTSDEEQLFAKYYNPNTSQLEKQAIREKVIKANLRFVFKQAKFYSQETPGMFEELICAGNEGLTVAFDKYSPDKNVKFLTYAGFWVNQRITDHMSMMRIVSLPAYKQQICARIEKYKNANPDKTKQEIIEAMIETGIARRHVEELYEYKFLTYYISDIDENNFLTDPIGEEVDKKMDDDRIRMEVANLPSPHREILASLFGFQDGKESSVSSISKILKISKEEVTKYRDEGLASLKKIFDKKTGK